MAKKKEDRPNVLNKLAKPKEVVAIKRRFSDLAEVMASRIKRGNFVQMSSTVITEALLLISEIERLIGGKIPIETNEPAPGDEEAELSGELAVEEQVEEEVKL